MSMTPQMQQSIKILQMTALDLSPYVTQEIEQNPFLDSGDGESDSEIIDDVEASSDGREAEVESGEAVWSDDEISPAIYDGESRTYSEANSGGSHDFSESGYGMDEMSSPPETLRDHVVDQINIDIADPIEKMIAVHLADMLDDNGYIQSDYLGLCERLKCDESQVLDVLFKLQKFDPVGVFARDLSECLSLQLKDKDRLDPAMEALVSNLDLVAKCDFVKLKKICAVDEDDIQQMCIEIKELNPRPGNVFSSEYVQVMIPDVFLKKGDKGKWQLELNSEALPRALVNRRYYSEVSEKINDKESKKFLSEQYNNANWLVRALDQRANTILKTATEIVMQQDSFFRYGIHYLRPLVLSDIAQKIEMHESTVSRVINGKYIATHMGVYELKYFFSSSVGGAEGDEGVSSRRIKYMIKDLVDKEDPKAILSDDKIAEMLKNQGIDVARRTVMKYRESMNIPSSVHRRRAKKS